MTKIKSDKSLIVIVAIVLPFILIPFSFLFFINALNNSNNKSNTETHLLNLYTDNNSFDCFNGELLDIEFHDSTMLNEIIEGDMLFLKFKNLFDVNEQVEISDKNIWLEVFSDNNKAIYESLKMCFESILNIKTCLYRPWNDYKPPIVEIVFNDTVILPFENGFHALKESLQER